MVLLGQTGLVAAYVLLALLLLSINLYSKWSWRVKVTSTIAVSLFYLVTYFSIPPLLGWPTDDDMPKRFNLVAIYVQEPDKATGHPGEIYLWATDLEKGGKRQKPRAYKVPFSQELHTRVAEAGTKMRKGLPQLGEVSDAKEGPKVTPEDATQGGQISVDIEFFDLPDPLFPEK
ncbi:MAG: hypothetical protein AAF384_17590 [Pseudomonadota bacterium]